MYELRIAEVNSSKFFLAMGLHMRPFNGVNVTIDFSDHLPIYSGAFGQLNSKTINGSVCSAVLEASIGFHGYFEYQLESSGVISFASNFARAPQSQGAYVQSSLVRKTRDLCFINSTLFNKSNSLCITSHGVVKRIR